MNEKDYKDIDDQMDFSPFNIQNDNSKSTKKQIKSNPEDLFTIVIHFPSHKSYSFEVPQNWTTKKLLSFIKSTFKREFNKFSPFYIYHGKSLSTASESLLKEYLSSDKINHVIITLKKFSKEIRNDENQNNLILKTNKDVFKSEEFLEMEKNAFDDYLKIFKNNSINNFPFMNPAYNHRREQIKINSTLEKLAAFEPVPLEEFPFRQYFQFNIIFKCIISFFAFGIYIKGFNFALFLSVLIGYYWYCINNVIDEFYKKKIQAIGISEEDYKEIKNGGFKITELNKKGGIFIIDNENEEDEKEQDKTNVQTNTNNINNNLNINTNINREANNIKNDIEEDLKEEKKDSNDNFENNKNTVNFGNNNFLNNIISNKEQLKDLDNKNKEKEDNKNINEKSPLLNNLNDILTGNNNLNLRGQSNNINNNIFGGNVNNNISNIFNNRNNINNINNINNKIEKKEEKGKKEQVENRPESALNIIFEIIYVFCISFIPSLCDEFEANNPIPVNNNNNNDNPENNNDNNNDNNINNNNNDNNNINNNFNNNINNDFNNNENNGSLNQEEDSNNNKMTSSRVVNMSDDSSRDNRMYKLIKKDNQSTNENEYVFSENGGIDNLSMNSELFKQKREKEKEKEKDKEKEKQIFEEDEEYLIEEDKKKKED